MTFGGLMTPELALMLNAGQEVLWGAVLVFTVANVALSVFDIPLPRGDVIGVGGTLDAIAVALLGPLAAAFSCSVGIVGALALRRNSRGVSDVAQTLIPRLSGVFAASLVYVPFSQIQGLAAWGQDFLGVSVYLAVELVIAQVLTAARTNRSVARLIRGNVYRLAPVMLAQLSTALLALTVYEDMGGWSLLLVVALLLLIRQSYSLLLEIGETYRTTIEVLVQAAEGLGSERQGHAERTAHVAREIAQGCGLTPRQVERVSYAALLHDISAISYGGDDHEARPTSSSVLEGVTFFEDVTGVLRICDGIETEEPVAQEDLLAAFIVALSSDVDAGVHRRVHADEPQSATNRVAPRVPSALKARAVSVAIRLGYRVPAVS